MRFFYLVRTIVSSDEIPVKRVGNAAAFVPEFLEGIARSRARALLGIADELPFRGEDLWTGYEFSWLNEVGKPVAAGLRVRVPCTSTNLVESKSMKLYLNGFAETRFESRGDVLEILENDLAEAFGATPVVEVLEPDGLGATSRMLGESLDALRVVVNDYERNPELLTLAEGLEAGRGGLPAGRVTAAWHTDLFRSICPITGQPDWASMMVEYTGLPIAPEGLLRYLVSYRRHMAFHEDTVERIFVDIMQRCRPDELTVYGRFLRRGGLDINPFRSTHAATAPEMRLVRQ
ncbi:MAG: NADPH-dependent 7-cyano-7-deazaguanine reductase QueF [Gammaproteobacteria bacterium]|nr:NADPH-dependent 7-cyano-7-deazaguanine reductase QueF [Gammaproteobacteria bacterium]